MAERAPVRALAAIALVLGAGACGDPPVNLEVPAREGGQHVLDVGRVLQPEVGERLADVSAAAGLDIVALTFTDERASLGQADRGGKRLLDAWDADVVLVTVARPGDFSSDDLDERVRFFGVFSGDRFDVSRALRERIIFDHAQAPAAENRWTDAYQAAIDELAAELPAAEPPAAELPRG